MRNQGQGSRTFGLGPAYWFGIPLSITAVVGTGWIHLQRPDPDTIRTVLYLAFIVALIAMMIQGWVRYHLDEEGLEVRTIRGRQHWRWDEIGGIHGDTYTAQAGRASLTTRIRRSVLDPERNLLFMISPWTADKRALARWIREHAAGLSPRR